MRSMAPAIRTNAAVLARVNSIIKFISVALAASRSAIRSEYVSGEILRRRAIIGPSFFFDIVGYSFPGRGVDCDFPAPCGFGCRLPVTYSPAKEILFAARSAMAPILASKSSEFKIALRAWV